MYFGLAMIGILSIQDVLSVKLSFPISRGSFREEYTHISSIRTVLSEQPIMCLKATATQSMVDEIINNLNLEISFVRVIAVLPDR